jgi:hypothetical protein
MLKNLLYTDILQIQDLEWLKSFHVNYNLAVHYL